MDVQTNIPLIPVHPFVSRDIIPMCLLIPNPLASCSSLSLAKDSWALAKGRRSWTWPTNSTSSQAPRGTSKLARTSFSTPPCTGSFRGNSWGTRWAWGEGRRRWGGGGGKVVGGGCGCFLGWLVGCDLGGCGERMWFLLRLLIFMIIKKIGLCYIVGLSTAYSLSWVKVFGEFGYHSFPRSLSYNRSSGE